MALPMATLPHDVSVGCPSITKSHNVIQAVADAPEALKITMIYLGGGKSEGGIECPPLLKPTMVASEIVRLSSGVKKIQNVSKPEISSRSTLTVKLIV